MTAAPIQEQRRTRDVREILNDITNVLDFGARGDGVTDDTAAIRAAVAALPAGTAMGTLYFPPGQYAISGPITISGKGAAVRGHGIASSVLRPMVNGAYFALTCDTQGVPGLTYDISDIGVVETGAMDGVGGFKVSNAAVARLRNTYAAVGSRSVWIENCVLLTVADGFWQSRRDGCVRIKGASGNISTVYARQGPFAGGYADAGPCLHLTGTTTSLQIGDACFTGGGPCSRWSIAGITSGAGDFTVTTTAPHDFRAGDFVALRGASVAGYNNAFRIASVTADTLTVTSTLNPGAAAAQGTAESLTACALIDNRDGAVNESRFSNCMFENGQATSYGTVAVYFDARRGPVGTAREMSGWGLTGCYHDFGVIGLLLSGTKLSGANDPSLYGFSVVGSKCESATRCVHIEGAQGIAISGLVDNSNQPIGSDYIVVDDTGVPRAMGIVIAAGDAAPYTQGISIVNSHIGVVASWYQGFDLARSKYYGIYFMGQGGANVKDVVVTGNTIYGRYWPIYRDAVSAYGGAWQIAKNITHATGIGTNEIPAYASAANLLIYPGYDFGTVTGAVNILNITPGWPGQEIKLGFAAALTLLSGGNLALGANYNVLAGQLVTFVFDGTKWYLK